MRTAGQKIPTVPVLKHSVEELVMKIKNPGYFLLAACGFCSLAFAASNRPASNQAGTTLHQAASAAVSDKVAKKISQAIGEEIEDFTVTAQQEIEAPVGYK